MTSVTSPNVQIIATPVPFSGSASGCGLTGTRTPNSGVIDLGAEQRLVALVVGMRDERDARRDQLGPRRVDLDEAVAVGAREADAVIGARLLAILELRLRDGRAEVHVPQRRRFELIREAALEQAQERQLRDALRAPVDRRVGHRPVDRQAEIAPQVLERLLVLGGQPRAQLDEVRTRHRDRLLAGLVRRLERRIVRQRRIAADAEVVLHAALGRQAVVVPSHRIEHGLAAHPLEARDDVGVGVGEDVADVQRAADRRRRRVDRVDLGARPACDRSGRRRRLPSARSISASSPSRAGLSGTAIGMGQARRPSGITCRSYRISVRRAAPTTRELCELDALDLLADQPLGDVEHRLRA